MDFPIASVIFYLSVCTLKGKRLMLSAVKSVEINHSRPYAGTAPEVKRSVYNSLTFGLEQSGSA